MTQKVFDKEISKLEETKVNSHKDKWFNHSAFI